MYNTPAIYLGEFELRIHWLLMALCFLLTMGLALFLNRKKGGKPAVVAVYGVLAAALGLFLGRAIYCAVCWYDVFLDEMGEFRGVLPFFDVTVGSANVMGIVAGVLLAAPIAAKITGEKAANLLDAAVVPGLVMYTLARVIEPLSGQGYGDLMGMEVCVCWLEAVLTLIVLALVPYLRKQSRNPGALCQYALTLWCLSQILPESLRCDEALYVFVFARVTHLGLAFTVGLTLIRLLIVGAKRGLDQKSILLDVLGLAVGIGLCIATIFALDKTNLPKLLVYAAMLVSLVELGLVNFRRIHKEDIR